jgi:hypothetical protein
MPARIDRELLIIAILMAVPMTSTLLLFSCGSRRAPQQLTVQVPDDFTGVLNIRACAEGASLDKLVADPKGIVATSACPHSDEQVTLLIIRAGKTYSLSPEDVKILRTGDGLATAIRAQVPRQP